MIIEAARLMDSDSAANDVVRRYKFGKISQLCIREQHEPHFSVAMLEGTPDFCSPKNCIPPGALEIVRDELLIKGRLRSGFAQFELRADFL